MARTTVKRLKTKSQATHRFANCGICGVNLSKWGLGHTNGAECPPCTQEKIQEDIARRKRLEEQEGFFLVLYVPDDPAEEPEIVDLTEVTLKELFGKGRNTCAMPHNPLYMGAQLCHSWPLYDGVMDDFAAAPDPALEENPRGRAVRTSMHVFPPDLPTRGPMVFYGPTRRTLLPKEARKFLAVAKGEK